MTTIELSHDGNLYEARTPPHPESAWVPALSAREQRALVDELWRARDHRQLERLCSLFAWGSRLRSVDSRIIERLLDGCGACSRISIHRRPRSRVSFTPIIEDAVDLRDLTAGDPATPLRAAETPAPTLHFFECRLEDEDGNPIAGQRCLVEPPDAPPFVTRTDDDGLIRYDELPRGGEYRITPLTHQPALSPSADVAPPLEATDDWFECVLLDPDREPVANQACEVVAPDGSVHECQSDDRGVVRLEGLGATGDCELRLVSGL
ncbi:MAG: hypothetical protein AAF799_25960 [Myxococcota bacterium]